MTGVTMVPYSCCHQLLPRVCVSLLSTLFELCSLYSQVDYLPGKEAPTKDRIYLIAPTSGPCFFCRPFLLLKFQQCHDLPAVILSTHPICFRVVQSLNVAPPHEARNYFWAKSIHPSSGFRFCHRACAALGIVYCQCGCLKEM
jgi:hypothetical protein